MAATQCIAKSKTSGNQCKRAAVAGATVCRFHGGAAPQVIAAAAKRIAQQNLDGEIGRLLAEIADEPMVGHVDGLEQACDRIGRMVAVLGYLAQGRDALAQNRFDEWGPDPLVEQYGVWLERYTRATKLALDAGIDERRTRLSELDAGKLFAAIDKAFDALTLTVDQRRAFKATLATQLRELDT